MQDVSIDRFCVGSPQNPLALIAGPCVIESLDLTADQKDQIFRRNAEKLLKI